MRRAGFEDAVEETCGLIDAAALRPALWAEAIEAAGRAVPGTRILFQAIDRAGGAAVPLTAANWPDACLDAYVERFAPVNPWAPVLLAARPDAVLWTEDELPSSAFSRTSFYADWLAPIGDAEVASGMKVFDGGGRCGVVVMHYGSASAERFHDDCGRALRRIGPRMRRALDLQRLAGSARLGPEPLLDRLAEPALVLDRDLVLHAGNHAGLSRVEPRAGLVIGPGDRLCHRDPRATQGLMACVRAALGEAPPPGPSGLVDLAGTPHAVCAVPFGAPMRPLVGVGPMLVPRALALVVLRPVRPSCDAVLAGRLAQRHGLTPAEARVATMMEHGERLPEIAARIGTSYETVRAQARAVYAKTGARGIAGVAALVARTRREA